MHLGPADGLYFRSQPIFHPCSVHSPGPACEICCLKAKIWSFLLLDLIVYKFNTKFNPFSKKIHPKLSSVAAFYLPSKFRSGVERYDEMRDLEKDRRGCSSTPPTQPWTSSYSLATIATPTHVPLRAGWTPPHVLRATPTLPDSHMYMHSVLHLSGSRYARATRTIWVLCPSCSHASFITNR